MSRPTLSAPPQRLVEAGEVTALGMFDGPIADVNLDELRPRGRLSWLRLKQWQHLAVVHPDVALCFAVVDTGYLRLGWIQVIDRQTDPWRASGDGIDLAFHGDGERRENLNLGILRSQFRQRYGRWSGTVDGHAVSEAWGLAEDHRSAW